MRKADRLLLAAGVALFAASQPARSADLHQLVMAGWYVRQDNGNFLPPVGSFPAAPPLVVSFTDLADGDVRLDITSRLDDPTLFFRAFNFNFAPVNGDVTTIDTRPLPLQFTRLSGFQDIDIVASANSAGPGGTATGLGGGIGKTDVWMDLSTGASNALKFAGQDSLSFLIHRTDGLALAATDFAYDAISGTANHTGRYFGAYVDKAGISGFGTFAASEAMASSVPEAPSVVLAGLGLALLAAVRLRTR
jgi:hypothetical protein